MTDVAWRMLEGAGDSIAAIFPHAIWRIRTRSGEPLDGIHVFAWRWLLDRTDGRPLPCRIEFKAVDLALRFGRSSHTSALAWLRALESAGLLGDVETERGAFGFTRLRMYDVEEVACRGELAARAADPQLEIELGLDDAPPGAVVVEFRPKCHDAAQHPDISSSERVPAQVVADASLERPEVPPALWEALKVHLGADNAEVYLGQARVEVAPRVDTRHRIYFANEYLRDYVRKRYARDLARSFADAGLHLGEVELHVDPRLAEKCHDAAQHPDITAQQPTLGLVLNPTRVQNQPTNQPIAAPAKAGETAEPPHPWLAAASELYQRIGDPTLWKWVAIAAVLLEQDGIVSRAELDALVATSGEDFGSALKQLAKSRNAWWTQGVLKSRLRAVGIHWKRSWERGLSSRKEQV